ncbi:putative auxin response factor [Helianthus anomalus]
MDATLSFGYVTVALAMPNIFQYCSLCKCYLYIEIEYGYMNEFVFGISLFSFCNCCSWWVWEFCQGEYGLGSRSFEVVYHPRATTPVFYVKALTVKAAMRIQWSPKMRLNMALEMEDSSQISWFMCTLYLDDVKGQFRWLNSPRRLLEVAWDEPDLLQNMKWVRLWLVELVLYLFHSFDRLNVLF